MLKHLKAREDWDDKSLSAKGFTLIELLVVIVILGVLAAVVIFAVGSVRDRAQKNACKTDAKTLKTAIVAWNTEYLSGDSTYYTTAYPSTEAAMTASNTKLLQEESSLWDFGSGGGNTVPVLAAQGTKCNVNDITQLS
ncbi:MAG: prepilin-type N-terminal cleavage/methylation domain-containing protein [Acidimicrobiales bacterium]